ncbi:MAG: hypothetical protein IIY93_09795 [Clostridia bacterium]|nr:hypothetical protein [Clostridia bacterium]
MKVCKKCGLQMPDHAVLCSNCGCQLPQQVNPQAPNYGYMQPQNAVQRPPQPPQSYPQQVNRQTPNYGYGQPQNAVQKPPQPPQPYPQQVNRQTTPNYGYVQTQTAIQRPPQPQQANQVAPYQPQPVRQWYENQKNRLATWLHKDRSAAPPQNAVQTPSQPQQANQAAPYQPQPVRQWYENQKNRLATWIHKDRSAKRPSPLQNPAKIKAITALILGLIGILLNFFGLSIFGLVISIVGIVLGGQSKKLIPKEHSDQPIAIWGYRAAVLGFIISSLFMVMMVLLIILEFLKELGLIAGTFTDFLRAFTNAWRTLKEIWGKVSSGMALSFISVIR